MKKATPLCRCGSTGIYKSFVWRMVKGSDKTKKEPVYQCIRHYQEGTFGLWPFVCTKKCRLDLDKTSGPRLAPEDTIVWLSLETMFPKKRKDRRKPKCPWCSRTLKSAPLSLL